jgi:uncharacterized protein (DUF3084 family)
MEADPTECEKGLLALVQHLRGKRLLVRSEEMDETLLEVCRWFIQKDLDSTEWWRNLLIQSSDQAKRDMADLHVEVARLRQQIQDLRNEAGGF